MLHQEMKGGVLEEPNSWMALLLYLFCKHSGTTSCAAGTVAGIRTQGWARSIPPLPPGFMVQYREQKTQTVKKGKSSPKKGHTQVRRERLWVTSSVVRGTAALEKETPQLEVGSKQVQLSAAGGPQEAVLTTSSALVLPEGHSSPHGWSTTQIIKSHSSSSRICVSSCRGSGSI